MANGKSVFGTRREARLKAKHDRKRTLVTSAFATALAALIGLSGVGGTYALLSASTSAPGATVQSGTLKLLVNNSSSAGMGNWAAAPAKPIARSFTVTNSGDAAADIAAQISGNTTSPLTSYATARVTPVANAAACVAGLSGTQGALNGYTALTGLGAVAPGATVTMCLEVGIMADAPASVSGQSLNFTLNVSGTQNAS